MIQQNLLGHAVRRVHLVRLGLGLCKRLVELGFVDLLVELRLEWDCLIVIPHGQGCETPRICRLKIADHHGFV